MKLEKFKQRNFKKIGISIFTVGCILLVATVFFYTSFASFEIKQDFNIIEGSVGSNGDLYFAFYVDNEISSKMPGKGEGYVIDKEKTTCTKGASVEFNEIEWSVKVVNMTERNTKCTLYFESRYSESILNGTDPVLEESLIAVTIEDDGTVKKADVKSEWYSYEKKEWANAIILKDESTANTYNVGDTIPESAIESYFVWIPRYRYQLWDLGNYDSLTEIDESKVHEIPVIFGNYTTLDEREGECTTPMLSGASGNCQIGDYMTHPAFLSIPSRGFWVGKFETGYDGATSKTEAEQNVNDSSKIIINPNVYSWRGIQVSNAFYTSYDYKRNLDSHMTKNTEWGAVAYLQHSAYGSQASVRINNNNGHITGYQANDDPTCGYTASNEECNVYCNDESCNTAYPNSILSSTTGNITGIYDMSGGSWEYVMGILLDQNGKPMSGRNSIYNSGFNGTFGCPTCDNDTSSLSSLTGGYDFPESKYYDTYAYATVDEQYQRRILGDATGEIGPFSSATYLTTTRQIGSWYADGAWFVWSGRPWFERGGNRSVGLDAGVFAFASTNGHSPSDVSFRIILTPTGGSA